MATNPATSANTVVAGAYSEPSPSPSDTSGLKTLDVTMEEVDRTGDKTPPDFDENEMPTLANFETLPGFCNSILLLNSLFDDVTPSTLPSDKTFNVFSQVTASKQPQASTSELPTTWQNQLEIAQLKAQVEMLLKLQQMNLSKPPSVAVTSSSITKILLDDARNSVHDYHGEHDPVQIKTMLTNLSTFVNKAKISDSDRIDIFGARMKGRAVNWWQYFKLTNLPTLPLNEDGCRWPAVELAFKKFFMPLHYEVEQTGKWHALTMNGGLLNYVRQFRIYMGRIPAATEREKWLELQFKIDQKARDFLEIKGIKNSTEALDALYAYALGNDQDARKMASHRKLALNSMRNTASSSAPRNYAAAVSSVTPEDSHKRAAVTPAPNNPTNKKKKINKSLYERIVITMANYNNFKAIPCVTKNLAAFLDANHSCRYCRQLNVEPRHTVQTCADAHQHEKEQALGLHF